MGIEVRAMTMTRILVVDDDRNTRRLLEAALTNRDYTVITASNGLEALDLIRAESFDLLISDLHMPDTDGQTVIEIAHVLQPGMGLILITGMKTQDSIVEGFRHGLHAYLQKPVDLDDLYRAVESALRARDQTEGSLPDIQIGEEDYPTVEFSAPSHHLFVVRFENFFRALFEDGVDEEVLEDLRIAILEMGANAVEWGNRSDQEKPVKITVKRTPDSIVLMIKDNGDGFTLNHVPDPTIDPIGTLRGRRDQGKRPGGYGIALVRKLVDSLVFSRQGNTVMIVKKLTRREKGHEIDPQQK
jgi:two-component system OmpR family response regulator